MALAEHFSFQRIALIEDREARISKQTTITSVERRSGDLYDREIHRWENDVYSSAEITAPFVLNVPG